MFVYNIKDFLKQLFPADIRAELIWCCSTAFSQHTTAVADILTLCCTKYSLVASVLEDHQQLWCLPTESQTAAHRLLLSACSAAAKQHSVYVAGGVEEASGLLSRWIVNSDVHKAICNSSLCASCSLLTRQRVCAQLQLVDHYCLHYKSCTDVKRFFSCCAADFQQVRYNAGRRHDAY